MARRADSERVPGGENPCRESSAPLGRQDAESFPYTYRVRLEQWVGLLNTDIDIRLAHGVVEYEQVRNVR